MARARKDPSEHFEGKHIKAPRELWVEFDGLVGSYRRSTVLQELMREFVRKKKAEAAGEALPAIEARLKRLEGKEPTE